MAKSIGKRGMEAKTLVYWIVAMVILVIIFIVYLYLKNNGINLIDYVINLLRLGR